MSATCEHSSFDTYGIFISFASLQKFGGSGLEKEVVSGDSMVASGIKKIIIIIFAKCERKKRMPESSLVTFFLWGGGGSKSHPYMLTTPPRGHYCM